jgi:hypothetical protein
VKSGGTVLRNEIEAEVNALLSRLQSDYPATMHVRKESGPAGNARSWFIEPVISTASPLWIIGEGWNNATVGFGRSSGRIELWQMGDAHAAQAAINLEKICRAVIDGGLAEWRQNERVCRYELRFPNGETYSGQSNTLLRRLWKTAERFSAYSGLAE